MAATVVGSLVGVALILFAIDHGLDVSPFGIPLGWLVLGLFIYLVFIVLAAIFVRKG